MKTYKVFCFMTQEADYALVDFDLIIRADNIDDALHKANCLLKNIKQEVEITEIGMIEE